MAVKKTNEQWLSDVYSLVGDEYVILDRYKNSLTKLKALHKVCGNEVYITPKTFLRGSRCTHCNPYRKRTTEEFKDIVKNLEGGNYIVKSEYTGHHSHITMEHVECRRVYRVAPSDFLKGTRCRPCSFKNTRKTNKEWLQQVKELTGDDYKFLEEYKGIDTKIRYLHKCGREHSVSPNNFINGTRCPNCVESSREANVRRYIESLGLVYDTQRTFPGMVNNKPLKCDFYIPKLNIVIEFQGVQHYQPVDFFGGVEGLRKQIINDNIKRDYLASKDIGLIEVHYSKDTYKKVRDYLESTLSKYNKCIVTQGALNQN